MGGQIQPMCIRCILLIGVAGCLLAEARSVASRCGIPIATAKSGTFSAKHFNKKYRQKTPVLLRNVTSKWSGLSSWATLEGLLERHGDVRPVVRPQIDIHSTNVPPGDTGVLRMSFREYLTEERGRDKIVLAFNDLPVYRALRPDFQPMPEALRSMHKMPMLTLGRNGTGSDGHRHEENWVAQIVGTKVWMLAPPRTQTPPQNQLPCPLLTTKSTFPDHMVICEVHPGEVIYLPDWWYHATCNFADPGNDVIAGIGAKFGSDDWPDSMFHLQAADEAALRAKGADIESLLRVEDPSPLHLAAKDGPVSLLELLLQSRADPHKRDRDGWSLIHTAAEAGTADVITYLLKNKLADPGLIAQGTEPLHMAAGMGHYEAARSLLEGRADANARDGRGSLPLHWAAASGDARLVQTILAHRANPAAKDKSSGTDAVAWAKRASHKAVLDLLVSLKKDKKKKEL